MCVVCSGTDAVRKRLLLFLLFFAVYVGCAVIAHKIDGLAGADPSMPLSNSRERSQALFPRLLKGFFSPPAAVLVKLSLFQQIQGHALLPSTSKLPLENLILYILYGFKVQSSSR